MLGKVAHLPGVESVVSPYSAAGAAQVSPPGNTAYATVTLAKGADVKPVEQAAEQLRSAALNVQVGGTAFAPSVGASEGTEAVGILAALLILLLVFRSVWAAALPVITGVTGVGLGTLAVVLGSHVVSLSSTSLTMGSLIGLGVGIDYALFIVNRYHKGLLAGESAPDAIVRALTTSGRAVVFAGVTVIAALLGMFVVNLSVLTGMAEAAAVTVLFTVASATTFLPALLAILGARVLSRRQRRALAGGQASARYQAQGGLIAGAQARAGHGLAARWAGLVERAPRRAVALSLLAIVAAAIPVLSMRVGSADASSDPRGVVHPRVLQRDGRRLRPGIRRPAAARRPGPGCRVAARAGQAGHGTAFRPRCRLGVRPYGRRERPRGNHRRAADQRAGRADKRSGDQRAPGCDPGR